MVNILSGAGQYAANASMAVVNAGVAVKHGVMERLDSAAPWMHDVYTLDGFEKWTKAMIADMRLVSLLPEIGNLFQECITFLEAQKDIYYATLFIGETAKDFMYKDTAGKMHFKLPRYAVREDKDLPGENADTKLPEYLHGRIDWNRLLYGVGHYFEVGKFLQKYKVFPFEMATQLANQYGSYTVFNRRLDDIPVVLSLFDKPKDACIFFASLVGNIVEVMKCKKQYEDTNGRTLVTASNILKFTSCSGKMVMIAVGKWYYKNLWFCVVDVLTQNASLFALIRKREAARQSAMY